MLYFNTMTPDYEFAVIGAGIVGLAIAAELAPRGPLLVLDKAWKFGQSTSSHNSEVVHAGLYYTPGSLKAKLCVEGNRLIRELAAQDHFGFSAVGKYIVATTDDEIAYLTWLKSNADANGVANLLWASPDELSDQEPGINAVAALFSPTTAILDSHGLMAHFKTQAEQSGADFVFNAEVIGIDISPPVGGGVRGGGISGSEGYQLTIRDTDGSEMTVTAECVINSAGLDADRIAALAGLDIAALDLELHWTRGFYYSLEHSASLGIRHLVYPVPDTALKSLGVHATIDLQGSVRFGPTAEYMATRSEDYSVTDAGTGRVAESISRYLRRSIQPHELAPVMAGIRPKLTRPGEPARDFYIQEESARGLPGFVNLIGIESPGLTASPAIAKYVATLI